MRFKTYEQLFHDTVHLAKRIPQFDLVVGVPRSGMIPATMFALHRKIRLTDLYSFAKEEFTPGGGQMKNISGPIKSVLILEDSVTTGTSLTQTKEVIKHLTGKYDIKYASIYWAGKYPIDYYGVQDDTMYGMEWNVFHHRVITQSCVDIDGVLAADLTNKNQDDDGKNYVDFVTNTPVLYRPTQTIHTICTSRIEKYRALTEEWLRKNKITYKKLVMSPYPNLQERMRANQDAENKAKEYASSNAILFIESSERQAKIIQQITKRTVFCTDNHTVYGEN